MKSILISIKPQYVAKILNGEKTIEIRKRFPKDYVGWVYIYCTKNGGMTYKYENSKYHATTTKNYFPHYCINGKVVARFWCDKVEEIKSCDVPFTFEQTIIDFYTDTFNDMDDLLKASCLDYYSLEQYLKYSKTGYAIHITKLEIFDKPKEISEFMKTLDNFNGLDCFRCSKHRNCSFNRDKKCEKLELTRAPQSWCYVEL